MRYLPRLPSRSNAVTRSQGPPRAAGITLEAPLPRRPSSFLCRAALAVALLGLGGIQACSGLGLVVPRTAIEGDDEHAFFPTGRVSWQLRPKRAAAPGEDRAADEESPPTRFMIDLDLAHSTGGFTQQVAAGDVIQIGSVPFNGPDVDVDLELLTIDVAAHVETRWAGGVGLGGRAGLGYTDLDIALDSGMQHESTTISEVGIVLGAELFYEPIERARLFLAFNAAIGLSSQVIVSYDYGQSTSTTLDLGVALKLHENVRLVGAWRQLDYKADAEDDDLSDLDFRLTGVMVGLWFGF